MEKKSGARQRDWKRPGDGAPKSVSSRADLGELPLKEERRANNRGRNALHRGRRGRRRGNVLYKLFTSFIKNARGVLWFPHPSEP